MKAFLLHILFALVLVTPAGAQIKPQVCPKGQVPLVLECEAQWDIDFRLALGAYSICFKCKEDACLNEAHKQTCSAAFHTYLDEADGHFRTCVRITGCH